MLLLPGSTSSLLSFSWNAKRNVNQEWGFNFRFFGYVVAAKIDDALIGCVNPTWKHFSIIRCVTHNSLSSAFYAVISIKFTKKVFFIHSSEILLSKSVKKKKTNDRTLKYGRDEVENSRKLHFFPYNFFCMHLDLWNYSHERISFFSFLIFTF